MFGNTKAFCSFSVNDIPKAKHFYGEVLGLNVTEEPMGEETFLTIHLFEGGRVVIYPKNDHVPATFTIMNFPVIDIEKTTKSLSSKGIRFEHYLNTDEKGISRNGGPLVAWFKDPAGNFLSVIEDETVEDKIEINKFIPVEKEKVFEAWTHPELLEKWSYPEGMKLVVELMEPKLLGRYIFRHTNEEGIFFTTGTFKEVIPNEKLIYSFKVKGPDGSIMLDTTVAVQFQDKYVGTDINLVQEGFKDWKMLKTCESAWTSSLENLFKLLVKGLNKPSSDLGKEGKDLH